MEVSPLEVLAIMPGYISDRAPSTTSPPNTILITISIPDFIKNAVLKKITPSATITQ
jgi:hypothetical protein